MDGIDQDLDRVSGRFKGKTYLITGGELGYKRACIKCMHMLCEDLRYDAADIDIDSRFFSSKSCVIQEPVWWERSYGRSSYE